MLGRTSIRIPGTRLWRSRPQSIIGLLFVGFALASCSDDADVMAPITVESDFQAPQPEDGEVFDQYIASRVQAFYSARDSAFSQPSANPEIDHPQLAKLSAEQQLDVVVAESKALHDKGWAHAEPDTPVVGINTDDEHRTSPVQSVTGDTVTVLDCEVNDDVVVDQATGRVEIEGVVTVLRLVTFRYLNDDWKITFTEVTERSDGVAGCYLSDEEEFPH